MDILDNGEPIWLIYHGREPDWQIPVLLKQAFRLRIFGYFWRAGK